MSKLVSSRFLSIRLLEGSTIHILDGSDLQFTIPLMDPKCLTTNERLARCGHSTSQLLYAITNEKEMARNAPVGEINRDLVPPDRFWLSIGIDVKRMEYNNCDGK
ncbi:hypothetical protein PILCRDRAFT_818899 [Piloderma croceum F 1598]|uniref:Uncharacterized protein n=1 Tax=Piloderma croceum (strain F 1598) TaxID=765440 RepID=A0A0C3FHL1_PILCF|nr:hypothetical protein PILCRDRAFT_818899 [Piloderma croceum F 1598]